MSISISHLTCRVKQPFHFQLGGSVPYLDIAYNLVGNKNGPMIFVAPSMSHSSLVARSQEQRHITTNTAKGWWENTVGYGNHYGIDLNHYQVLSAAPLGSIYSTTSPLSINPHTNREYRLSFPVLTPYDQARCHAMLIKTLGFASQPLHAIIGSSMGGMSVIEAMIHVKNIAKRAVVIATTARSSPSTQALRSVQRDAVRLDPIFQNGEYDTNHPPINGMKLARKIGTIAYRSRSEFDRRFSHLPTNCDALTSSSDGVRFQVDSYLSHQANSFGNKFDACCWMRLSECMDLCDVSRMFDGDFKKACQQIDHQSEWLVLPVTEDALIPAADLDQFAVVLGSLGIRVHLERLQSMHGHDAFLTEPSLINWRLNSFLNGGVDGVRQRLNELHGH